MSEESRVTKSAPRTTRRVPKRRRTRVEPRTVSLEEFRRRFPEVAPNRYVADEAAGTVVLELGDGSSVTKGPRASMTLEVGRASFRVEIRGGE